jgi:hypothetical protein
MRFTINYGILEINKINYKANEISTIIQNYTTYIEDFKKLFKLEKNSLFINDTIF